MRGLSRIAAVTAVLGMAVLAACGGGGGASGSQGGTGVIPQTPLATSTPGPNTVLCTTSGSPQSIAQASISTQSSVMRAISQAPGEPTYVPGIIEITYRSTTLAAHRSEAENLASEVGRVRGEISSAATGLDTQVVAVDPSTEDRAMARVRASSLVQSVTRAVARYRLSTTPAFTNDPYFQGFTGANSPPFYESAAIPGQWDMHESCDANAWGYANANSTGRTFAAAAGGTAAIAIVDTGADVTHRDLSHVAYTETVLNGQVSTTGMHDNDGHGTNVAGIAAATGNNAFGFAGVAYAAPLMIFKVFPDPPPGGCAPGSTSAQCSASGADVGLAIQDAVSHGARVINLSLGASGPDTAEESAVANAIAHGVVVVAASGNESAATLDYPAADPGVIAVGASALDDSNPSAVSDKVAGYSNFSSANPSAWGLVAPGGDPSGSLDFDDLHWIENLFTSTAADGSSAQACATDRAGSSGDCRSFFAGTSQATPHVTGAVALLLSINSGLSPASVKSVLCSTAVSVAGGRAGCGRLNVYKAMAQVVGDPSP